MCRLDRSRESSDQNSQESQGEAETKEPSYWKLWTFLSLQGLDFLVTLLLLTPILPIVRRYEGAQPINHHYTLYGSLVDLLILTLLRLVTTSIALLASYSSSSEPPSSPFDLHHKNGDRKSREELDNEALEEPFGPWFRRYVSRLSFFPEVICLFTGLLSIAKCLCRLNVELGRVSASSRIPPHPIFWLVLLWTAIICTIVSIWTQSVALQAGEYGRAKRARLGVESTWMRRIGSSLSIPLLSSQDQQASNEQDGDLEQGSSQEETPDEVRGVSDISGDAAHDNKVGWSDLLRLCAPDVHFIMFASVFLLLAATAEIYIPKFMGNILDALSNAFANPDVDNHDMNIWQVPGFISNVKKLVVASILCGIFSGLRGSIFTIVGGRVNVRLRVKLMDALLSQDIGFFDVTKTGDITSRLSSDTTLVADQVQLNVNVFLRSLVQVIGVLIFMFILSWQLSLLAFISVPAITILSKWYGEFVRRLTKLMQKKLADGNSVSESTIGSMATVRAFDAAESELKEFEKIMEKYLSLNIRAAVAYLGYCSCITSLPNLVTAVVLYYGGLLVRNGDMSSGQLVSFLLYLQSLSSGFGSIGYIFSSLTQAVGAADKVFELMNRKPKLTPPAVQVAASRAHGESGILGVEALKTAQQRQSGVSPESCEGEITLENVEMFYPARPQRRVLNGLSLKVPSGSVVALVGPSGGGKSSIMSLLQHLYEAESGNVVIDGKEVHDLNPTWLSRHLSVVSQEPTLFARSITRNIMYGLEGTEDEPSQEQIEEAARLANASSFIEKLPFGFETDVGERGVQLSGGQKQRIAIARALVRKPRILLLDEATSALDAESEALVQGAIDDMLARGRETEDGRPRMTVLIVAHRLSTVRNADVIFVVKDGQVVESGSHDELVCDPNGEYSNLINRQMNAQNKLESGEL